jgi:hypothetical protein
MTASFPFLSKAASLGQRAPALRAVDWLSLAATPTFAGMALLTASHGGSAPDAVCSTASNSSVGGMTVMYLLMSSLHSAPWLRLIFSQRARQSNARRKYS